MSKWSVPAFPLSPISADYTQKAETRDAYEKLGKLAADFRGNVSLISDSAFDIDGENCLLQIYGGLRIRPD